MSPVTASLLVAAGSAAGGCARYWLSLGTDAWCRARCGGLGVGTLLVNVLGSAAIAVIAVHWGDRAWVRCLLMAGFLGGFTTFSAFSLEVVELLRGARFALAALAVGLSLALCLGGAVVGGVLATALGGGTGPSPNTSP
jgi:CrcB protein